MKWFKSIFGLNKRPKSDVRDSADTALTPSSEVNKTLTFGSASEALDKLVSDNCSAAEHMLSQSGDPALPTLIADRLIGNLNCSCEKLIRLAGERGDHLSVEPLKTIVRELLSKNSGQYIIRDSMLALYRIQGTEVHGLLMECLKSMDWIWRQHAAFFLCEIEEEYAKKHIKGTYYSQASELRHLIMARGFGAGRQVTNTDPYEAVWQKELSRMSDVLETIPATREYRKYWHVRGPGGDELLDHPPEGTDQQKLNAIMDKIRTAAQTNPVEAQLLRNTAVAFMEHHANSEFSKTNTIDSAPIEPSQQPSASLSAATLVTARPTFAQPLSVHYLFSDKSDALSVTQALCDAPSLPTQIVKLVLWDIGTLADHDVLYYEPIVEPQYSLTFTFEQLHSADFDKWKGAIPNAGFQALKDRLGRRFSVLKSSVLDTELSQLEPGDSRLIMHKDILPGLVSATAEHDSPSPSPSPSAPQQLSSNAVPEYRALIWDMERSPIGSHPVPRDWDTDYGKGIRMFPANARRYANGITCPGVELQACELSAHFREMSLSMKVKDLTQDRPQTYKGYKLINEEYTTLCNGNEAAYLEYEHIVEGVKVICHSIISCSSKYICTFIFRRTQEDPIAYREERIKEYLRQLEIH